MTLSALALIGVMASVVLRLWLPAVILGAFSISAIVVATVLIRRAEPDELQALAAANEALDRRLRASDGEGLRWLGTTPPPPQGV